jgi:hypothetical protein
MSGHTDSDDASEIFWPGYVDAVTNLAINLLFVIAVMSIVVLAVTMAMRKASNVPTSQSKGEKRGISDQSAASAVLNEMRAQKEAAEKQVSTLSVTVAQLQAQLEKMQKRSQSQSQSSNTQQTSTRTQAAAAQSSSVDPRNKQDAVDSSPTSGASALKKVEVVTASQTPVNDSVANTMRQVTSYVLVLFSKNSVTLEDAEAQNLVKKMAEFAPVAGTSWHIEVIVPKGFSEALRLGYYRVNAVRNVLLQNGVAPTAIEMKVVESDLPGADNSRVLVRPAK